MKYPWAPVLLVDDEAQALQSFEIALHSAGINHTVSCRRSDSVLPLLAKEEVGIILLDLWMPRVSGEEILLEVVRRFPVIPVIVVTGLDEVDTAVRCIKAGAFDYLVKPVERNRLVTAVERAIELRELRRENTLLKQGIFSRELNHPEAFAAIIHASREMRAVLQYTEAIACTSQTVLITGETGVGKELVARAVHIISGRKGPFVAVNVAGLDDNVFSDTLFGHKKGAFTGAEEKRSGLLEKASGGTLFLDEIGDLHPSSQVKLLRLLQEHEYFPLGSDILKQSDARIVVATNKDIQDLQESGRLRADLYFRLHTHHVHIPPLKERTDDLPVLLDHFFEAAARALKKKTPTVPKELLDLCKAYSFPGNVRELESMVFDAVSSHGSGVLSLNAFKKAMGLDKNTSMRSASDPLSTQNVSISFSELLPKLKEAEQILIDEAMKRADGNQGIAASMLGISRQALNRRLKTRKK